jgi:hypothetical protein
MPVFFSVLSKAQTFSTGSFDKSSAIVTNNDVSSTCLMCVIEACFMRLEGTYNLEGL